jgi:hypothetical protein
VFRLFNEINEGGVVPAVRQQLDVAGPGGNLPGKGDAARLVRRWRFGAEGEIGPDRLQGLFPDIGDAGQFIKVLKGTMALAIGDNGPGPACPDIGQLLQLLDGRGIDVEPAGQPRGAPRPGRQQQG